MLAIIPCSLKYSSRATWNLQNISVNVGFTSTMLTQTHNRTYRYLLICCCLLSMTGCADGPFQAGTMNPWLRKEWAKDEARGPTFHTKMTELQQLAQQASSYDVNRQDQLATEMSERFAKEGNPLLRAAMVKVMGNLKSPQLDTTLQAAVKDPDNDVRITAIKALGARGDENSLETLASVMSTETQLDVRMATATELRRFKNSQEATRALALALDDNDAALQYRAIQSLQEVTGRNYGVNAAAWREYLAGGNPAPAPAPSIAERFQTWSWR
jgi:HEAT repeats